MALKFAPAKKSQSKLRLCLVGPSGSGKTYSALAIASGLGSRVAVIDTERGSASLYADRFKFDVLEPDSFSPRTYVDALATAAEAGYEVVVIDSLTHAWTGKDGALEQLERIKVKKQSENSFVAWREVTPMHNALVEAMLRWPGHLIATMRVKTEYVIEENDRGKKVPRKIGLAPIQRDGLEYEFTAVADMDLEHNFITSKTRCEALDGKVVNRPGADVAKILRDWLESGEPAPAETSNGHGSLELELLASTLIERIKKIENKFELAAWKKKHADEIKSLPQHLYEKVVETGKAKAAEFEQGSAA